MTDDISGEHPPYDLNYGQSLQQRLITALMLSRYWRSSAYILTYDEAGGFFDHVRLRYWTPMALVFVSHLGHLSAREETSPRANVL